ncbi:MAG: hypothetical protein ACJAXX_000878 [Roseivirga sp.]
MKETKDSQIPLVQFQQWMQQMLLDPFQKTEIDPKSFLPDSYKSARLDAVINHSDRLPAHEHLAIYQRSYIARLRNCMSQQFSALEYALGEELFCAFADDYLANQPSSNYNLAELGRNFPHFLEVNRPDFDDEEKEDWIDFIIELAKFEYAIGIIFEEKADENYVLADSSTLDERLALIPVFYLFNFQFPIRWFYTEFKNGNTPDLPHENQSCAVVIRHNYKLAIYDLHKEQFDFLHLLKEYRSIPVTISHFMKAYDTTEIEETWRAWRSRWVKSNFFKAS